MAIIEISKKHFLGYIYKKKLYLEKDYNELFNDALGFYLDYHIEVDGELKVVHSLEEVAELLLNNLNTFEIPKKYIKDFSEREYQQFIKVQKFLKE